MPELPEVETFARTLRSQLTGRTILVAHLYWPRTLETPTPAQFHAEIVGQEILEVSRRAKYLHIALARQHLFIHLRMSGDLRIVPPPFTPEKHDRVALELSDGNTLAFNDTRKFGRIWLATHPEDITGHLGPEPLAPTFTSAVFYARLHGKQRQIKPLLLDQTFIAGLGNIYTDESLHRAKIHPLRPAHRIAESESSALFLAIRESLQAGIEHNGASIDWVYRGGGFQNYFRVYGRTGQPCPVCGTPIQRILVGQRSTHFCPTCQPVPSSLDGM